jgi:hypothetical protein
VAEPASHPWRVVVQDRCVWPVFSNQPLTDTSKGQVTLRKERLASRQASPTGCQATGCRQMTIDPVIPLAPVPVMDLEDGLMDVVQPANTPARRRSARTQIMEYHLPGSDQSSEWLINRVE